MHVKLQVGSDVARGIDIGIRGLLVLATFCEPRNRCLTRP